MPANDDGDAAAFPKTSWSLIGRATTGSPEQMQAAIGELVRRYLPALRSYLIIGKRLSADAADDLLQAFLVSKVLEQQLMSRAEAQRGKFRSFLLASLNNFLIDAARAAKARKRSPTSGAAALDNDDLGDAADPADRRTKEPPEAFEEAWAREVIHRATELMQQECEAEGRTDLWIVFEQRLLAPSRNGTVPVAYEALADQLRLATAEQVANLLVTAKRMFNRNVRAAIAEYVGESEVDQEIYELREALSRASPR